MTEADKIRARIQKLRAKVVASGCSEAEALAAAEMAARLMAEAGLSDADVDMVAERATETTTRSAWRAHICASVMRATNTHAVLMVADRQVEFIGRAPGPEVAAYLYEVLVGAVLREARRYKEGEEYKRRRTTKTRRAALTDFASGMVVRLRARLLEMFAATISDAAQAEALGACRTRHTSTTVMSSKLRKPRFDGAAAAGYAAGGDVTIAHGIAGKDVRPLAIEGGRS
ncbi:MULTISPECIES: DUF7168 domain-containing protein [unclassified Xanthobacter]|uniref:DUF7168 domain-containing protein n=1 Tax=unclassified Xanthobacter TaxID=2623496 RepID=UPI001EE0686F|nr:MULTISPECIES: DUF2786 domain-containing protein [unclassified Xanthobacter]